MGKQQPPHGLKQNRGGQPPTWKYSAQNSIKGGRNYNIKSQIINKISQLNEEEGRGTVSGLFKDFWE